MSAPDGTPVYASLSGRVVIEPQHPEAVSVRGDDGRTVFSYWHVVPAVRDGQRVNAYRSVLGTIASGWAHVHFAELHDGAYVNPLRRGAMSPYKDTTCPTLRNLRGERRGVALRGGSIAGWIDLVVEALDEHPVHVPAPWTGKPVTPATISWRLLGRGGDPQTPWRTAYNVQRELPATRFDLVYARWTRQNSARRVGRYRFYLAHAFDTTAVSDGAYVVVVRAADTAGNEAQARFPLVVANEAGASLARRPGSGGRRGRSGGLLAAAFASP